MGSWIRIDGFLGCRGTGRAFRELLSVGNTPDQCGDVQILP